LSRSTFSLARGRLEPDMKVVMPEAGIGFDVMSGFPGLDALARRNDHRKVAYRTEAGLFAAAGSRSAGRERWKATDAKITGRLPAKNLKFASENLALVSRAPA
jgi:hypothetical protein